MNNGFDYLHMIWIIVYVTEITQIIRDSRQKCRLWCFWLLLNKKSWNSSSLYNFLYMIAKAANFMELLYTEFAILCGTVYSVLSIYWNQSFSYRYDFHVIFKVHLFDANFFFQSHVVASNVVQYYTSIASIHQLNILSIMYNDVSLLFLS